MPATFQASANETVVLLSANTAGDPAARPKIHVRVHLIKGSGVKVHDGDTTRDLKEGGSIDMVSYVVQVTAAEGGAVGYYETP